MKKKAIASSGPLQTSKMKDNVSQIFAESFDSKLIIVPAWPSFVEDFDIRKAFR